MLLKNKFTWNKKFWLILGAVTLIHGILNLFIGLGDDEAYHWVWSRHLCIGYYDHPPFVAYVIWLFTRVFGKSYFSVHLGGLVCVTLFIAILYIWVKEMFSPRVAGWTGVSFLFMPIFFTAGTTTVPDGPLGVFWVLSLWLVYRALKEEKTYYWYLSGLTMGLSCLSKYNGLALPLLIFLYLFFSSEHRYWLFKKEPYLTLLLVLIIFSPVIIWNYQHQWVSFKFQFLSRHRGGISFLRFLQFLGGQFAYLGPLAFLYACVGFYRMLKVGFKVHKWIHKYLFFTSFPIVFLFAINSFFSRSFKPHWPALGYIGPVVSGISLGGLTKKEESFLKANVLVCLLLLMMAITHILCPFLPVPAHEDITNDFYGWDKVAQVIMEVERELSQPAFLLTDRYQISSRLIFFTGKEVYTLRPRRLTQFNFWQSIEELKGKDAIYVTHSRYFKSPDEIYRFGDVRLVREIRLFRRGREIRTFYLYLCEDFQGLK